MPKLLEVSGLRAAYGSTQVLHGLDFALDAGAVVAILGANGAGKTTTLRALSQAVHNSGSVLFEGVQLVGRATEDVARLGIAHVPDGRGTFTALSVRENLLLGGHVRAKKSDLIEDMDKAFGRFPILKQRLQQQAGTLSGGEQQMLAISRALMLRPKLLLLDEPSFGLAPRMVAEIYATLRSINRKEGLAILLVEQNAALALDVADRAYLLETGRVALSGSRAELSHNESVRRAYLGHG